MQLFTLATSDTVMGCGFKNGGKCHGVPILGALGSKIITPTTSPPPFTDTISTQTDGVTEYVSMPAHLIAGAGSVSLWVKALAHGANDRIITCGGFWFIQISAAGAAQFVINDGGGKSTPFSSALTIGSWFHLVGTWDSSFIKFYKDGSFVGQTAAGAVANVSNPVQIGGAAAVFFNGIHDEVSTWDKALDLTEVQEVYNSGSPDDLSNHSAAGNIITWLRMGDGDTYPTILDQVGSNDGTMTNMSAANFQTDAP